MAEIKTRPRKTVEDYLRLPEGVRAELIEGEIFMSPSPKTRHQIVAGKIYKAVSEFVESKRLGMAFFAPLDVHLPSGDVVQPDIIFVAQENLGIIRDWIRGVPDLLIEVVSPDNPERDRVVKRDLYARNGVREYWIVDPEERTVEVVPQGYFEEADVVTSPLLDGLSLPARTLFE